eukprot:11855325-Ditylum_brightwellii.AAC.1
MAVDAIKSGLAKGNEDVELNYLVFSMMRCSLTCGINKKQWGNNKSKEDNNSQDCGTYVVSDVGGARAWEYFLRKLCPACLKETP